MLDRQGGETPVARCGRGIERVGIEVVPRKRSDPIANSSIIAAGSCLRASSGSKSESRTSDCPEPERGHWQARGEFLIESFFNFS